MIVLTRFTGPSFDFETGEDLPPSITLSKDGQTVSIPIVGEAIVKLSNFLEAGSRAESSPEELESFNPPPQPEVVQPEDSPEPLFVDAPDSEIRDQSEMEGFNRDPLMGLDSI